MKVAILTQFSRGDVQPFAALARGLTAAGHRVVVGAPGSSAELVEPHADRVVRLDDVAARLMSEIGMRRALDVSYHGLRGKVLGMRHMRRHRALVAATRDDLVRAVDDDVDVVVHHGLLPGHQIAERLGVPAVPVFIDPFWVPTNAFADPEFPFRLPAGLNDPLRGPDGTPATVLQAFSRHAIHAPLDYPEWVHTTGYWFLPANDGLDHLADDVDVVNAVEHGRHAAAHQRGPTGLYQPDRHVGSPGPRPGLHERSASRSLMSFPTATSALPACFRRGWVLARWVSDNRSGHVRLTRPRHCAPAQWCTSIGLIHSPRPSSKFR